MTLEKIENHVIKQAREEAEAITTKTREEARRITAEAREQAEGEYAAAVDRLKGTLDTTLEQEIGKLDGRHRMELLDLKSKILDDVFRQAVEKLLLDDEHWKVTWKHLREVAGQKGQILCRAEHHETFAKKMAELETALVGARHASPLPPLADEPAPILGGFIFRCDKFDADFSLDSQLEAFREKLLPELVARAFPEQ